MPLTIQAKAIVGVAALVLVAGSLFWIYEKGVSHGESVVQAEWDKDTSLRNKAMAALQSNYDLMQASNRQTTQDLTHDLAEAKSQHAVAMANAQSDFDKRLLQSDKRASVYKRMSEAGSSECGNLASHAAELDRSLEQGRLVVTGLRETLRLRDSQLTSLGAKLLADRQLIAGTK